MADATRAAKLADAQVASLSEDVDARTQQVGIMCLEIDRFQEQIGRPLRIEMGQCKVCV